MRGSTCARLECGDRMYQYSRIAFFAETMRRLQYKPSRMDIEFLPEPFLPPKLVGC